MEPVNVALFGIGMIGREHARILDANPGANLLAVCDTDPDAAQYVPDGVEFTTDLDAALGTPGLEAVWVCTPQAFHLPVVEAALDRGLAVFCEKPIAASIEDANAMLVAAERNPGPLAIGHTLRFDPNYIAVHDAVAAGELGEIVHLAARWNAPDYEGRIISGRTTVPAEMAIHDLDIMRWLVGPIERIYAEAAGMEVVGPGPDAAVGTVRFASGAVGALDHNWILPGESGVKSDHRLAVFGARGAASVESRETPAVIFTDDSTRFLNTTYYSYPNGIPFGALPTADAYLLAMVRDGRPWPISLEDARAALVAATAMEKSIETGRPVLLADVEAGRV